MGLSTSHPSRDSSDVAVNANVEALPPPRYEDMFWMASCRPTGRGGLSRFCKRAVLFRSDCRLFCTQGLACKFLTSGEEGRTHRELFIHTTLETVRAAANRDMAARNPCTVIVNDGAASLALPFVPSCWALDRDLGAVDVGGSQTEVTPTVLAGRTVVIWVHGFRQRFFRAVSVGHHLFTILGTGPGDRRPAVVTFLWPCHLRAAAYGRARSDADRAATHLAELIRALKTQGCRVVIMAHSLGCRVALRALLRPDSSIADEEEACSHLLLLGAAVSSDALSTTGDFPRARVAACQITVLSSTNDDTLRKFFAVGETASGLLSGRLQTPPSALGLVGVTEPFPTAVQHFDVSRSVPAHNPNIWLMSRDVAQHLVAAASSNVEAVGDRLLDNAWPDVAHDGVASDEDLISLEEDEEDDGA